jgi:hypothetical protein
VADLLDAATIGAELRRNLTGAPPPADLVDRLGGWRAIETLAPTLVDAPLLTVALSLLTRGAHDTSNEDGDDLDAIRPAATALAEAVLATTDPMQFTQNIDAICTDDVLAGLVGTRVAAKCLTFAGPPRTNGDDPAEASVLRHAVALETVARLAVLGHGSKNKLLGLLEDVAEPQPRRYAQAVVRTVGLAFDHWTVDDETAQVIDTLTGEKAPKQSTSSDAAVLARSEQFRRDIASDAMWTKANVEVARALRCSTTAQVIEHLDRALEALEIVTTIDDRDDATMLSLALRVLHGLLVSLDGTSWRQGAATRRASVARAEDAARQAQEFTVSTYGLTHWSGDRKIAVLRGWGRLAHDLAWLRDQLGRDSLYDAAVVLDDILAIYSASRSYDITRIDDGEEHIVSVIRPAVAGGFAARAGLLRHLIDHTENLRRRLTAAQEAHNDTGELEQRLTTAETVLTAARSSTTSATAPPGKHHEQAAPLPPLLAELLGPHPTITDALASADPVELAALTAAIADRQAAADPDPDIVVSAIRQKTLAQLSVCEDFTGDVVPAVTGVLEQLIKFVARRLNTQKSTKSYLFDPNADEHDLHADLYDWLSQGQFSSATNVEVQEVGGGRVDIQIAFPGFHLYLELKADDTTVPVAEKAAYIKQTVSYQASDVRIGFLVVLRLKPAKDKSPSPHLTELVSHTVLQVQETSPERHVVMLEVPGNQTKPSSVH